MEKGSMLEIECVGKFTNSADSFEKILARFRYFHDLNVSRPDRRPAASELDQLAIHFRQLCNEGLAHVDKVCSGWCEEALLLYENVGTEEEAEFREQAMKGAEEAAKSFGAMAEGWKEYLSKVTIATNAVIEVYTAEEVKAREDVDEAQKEKSQAEKNEAPDTQRERTAVPSNNSLTAGLFSRLRNWNEKEPKDEDSCKAKAKPKEEDLSKAKAKLKEEDLSKAKAKLEQATKLVTDVKQFVADNEELAAAVMSACNHLRGHFAKCKRALTAGSDEEGVKNVNALKSSLKKYYDAMVVVTSKYNFKALQR